MTFPQKVASSAGALVAIVVAIIAVAATVGGLVYVLASNTSSFTQNINAGTLTTDIVDGSYASVASPSVPMSTLTFSFSCQTSTGSFGTSTENIYVQNPDGADNGWTLSLAASATTDLWTSGSNTYDFNDSSGSGCTDGADADSKGGQMTVDPSGGTLLTGQCASCATTGISKGSSTPFVQDTTDSVTLLSAAAGSNDIGDWRFRGVSISQKVPGEQPAASGYALNMVLSVVAL
ncbi:MAG: hypothetical protein U0517_01495 [Candidatus Andersenbacteria bacterium]